MPVFTHPASSLSDTKIMYFPLVSLLTHFVDGAARIKTLMRVNDVPGLSLNDAGRFIQSHHVRSFPISASEIEMGMCKWGSVLDSPVGKVTTARSLSASFK
jgi:hypothetical protein